MKKFLRVISIITLLVMLCYGIVGCAAGPEPETTIVQATVTNKEYIESYTDYGYYWDMWKGKFRWKFKTFPAEYKVTVEYQDFVETYDNKSLYESVEIGDTIDMKLTTYFNSDGEIYRQSFSRVN